MSGRRKTSQRRHGVSLLLAASVAAYGSSALQAATSWKANPAAPANWFTSANWTDGIPESDNAADLTYINNGGMAQIDAGSAISYALFLGSDAGTSGSLAISGGSLQVVGTLAVGYSGNGTFTQFGGSVSGQLHVAYSAGSSGTYTLTNGTLTNNSTLEEIGVGGAGTFIQSGGTNTTTGLRVGAAGIGHYSLLAGTLSVSGSETLRGANSAFDQSGGTNTASSLSIGSTCAYSLTGGTLQFTFGLDNAGAFTLGGTAVLNVGGMVNLAGATFQDLSQVSLAAIAPNSLLILPPGSNTANFKSFVNSGMTAYGGAPITIPAGVTVAAGAGGSNDLIVCSGMLTGYATLNGGIMVQGSSADATALLLKVNNNLSGISNGKLSITGSDGTFIGESAPGTFTQTEGQFHSSGEFIGYNAAGNFLQSGGTHTVSVPFVPLGGSAFTIGYKADGNYSLTGGLLNVTGYGFERIGFLASGNFVQTAGTHSILMQLSIGSGNPHVGTYLLSGGSLSVPNLTISSGSTFSQTAGTLAITSLTNSGFLHLDGPATISFLNLKAGILSGHGTISGQVLAGSTAHTIAPSFTLPASAAGTLTVGKLTTSAGTLLALNLVTPGTNDSLNITASNGLTLNGGNVQIANVPNTAASLGYYRILQYVGAIQGAGLSSLAAPPAQGDITYSLDATTSPGFITLHRGFPGDANDDGTVNFADFVQLSNHYGQANQGWMGGDFDNSGATNFADFVIMSNHYGQSMTGQSFTATADELAAMQAFAVSGVAVPEPASLALLLPLVVLLPKRRR